MAVRVTSVQIGKREVWNFPGPVSRVEPAI